MELDQELKEDLATLEYILITKLRPTYLELNTNNDSIYIVLSTLAYERMNIYERVSSIFALLKTHCQYILDKYLVVVQGFNSNEITQLLEGYSENELS